MGYISGCSTTLQNSESSEVSDWNHNVHSKYGVPPSWWSLLSLGWWFRSCVWRMPGGNICLEKPPTTTNLSHQAAGVIVGRCQALFQYYMTTFWGRLLHTSWCWFLCVCLIRVNIMKNPLKKKLVHWQVAFATSFILWLMEKPGFRPYTHHLDRRQGFANRHHTRIDGRDLHFFFPWWGFCSANLCEIPWGDILPCTKQPFGFRSSLTDHLWIFLQASNPARYASHNQVLLAGRVFFTTPTRWLWICWSWRRNSKQKSLTKNSIWMNRIKFNKNQPDCWYSLVFRFQWSRHHTILSRVCVVCHLATNSKSSKIQ